MNLKEALDRLDLYDKIDKVYDKINSLDYKSNSSSSADVWNDNYDNFIWASNTTEAFEKKGKVIPEIGDIAILKIKLRTPDNHNKKVYDGYKRRPILVIRAKSNSVDALEITHKEYFNGYKLIPIGKLNGDSEYSYVNIYSINEYTDLPVSYKFPKAFNKDNTPMSHADYNRIKLGVIYHGQDKEEPYIVDFTYRDNYKGQIDDESFDRVMTQVVDYVLGEEDD